MQMKTLIILSGAALAAIAPATAQTPVGVPQFRSVQLEGGGQVMLRHGPRQSVTLVRGSREMTRFTVEQDGTLVIDACVRSCRNYDLRVEIVSPSIEGVAIEGGGAIRAQGAFPASGNLAAAISGGGMIDVRAIPSRSVSAAIQGGGAIRTDARDSLMASINGGGAITYRGNPSTTVAINGGGSVNRESGR